MTSMEFHWDDIMQSLPNLPSEAYTPTDPQTGWSAVVSLQLTGLNHSHYTTGMTGLLTVTGCNLIEEEEDTYLAQTVMTVNMTI